MNNQTLSATNTTYPLAGINQLLAFVSGLYLDKYLETDQTDFILAFMTELASFKNKTRSCWAITTNI